MNKKKRKAKREALKKFKQGKKYFDAGCWDMNRGVSQAELRLSAVEKIINEMTKKLHMKNRLS